MAYVRKSVRSLGQTEGDASVEAGQGEQTPKTEEKKKIPWVLLAAAGGAVVFFLKKKK